MKLHLIRDLGHEFFLVLLIAYLPVANVLRKVRLSVQLLIPDPQTAIFVQHAAGLVLVTDEARRGFLLAGRRRGDRGVRSGKPAAASAVLRKKAEH